MCGICGAIDPDRPLNGDASVRRMVESIRHRGPDSTGVVSAGPAVLGFARLAIIDLSDRANQPMAACDGKVWLTFNGELYNYIELRGELERSGHVFRTASDTEVALRAYLAWGESCFERYRGMWGLAIWDGREGKLVLSRDYFGIKPLFYARSGKRFLWASEVKALLASGVSAEEDARSSARFLQFGCSDDGERTFYRDVRRLPPGHVAVVDANLGCNVRPFFRLDHAASKVARVNEQDAVEECRSLLLSAARISLRSDVPVRFLLSGGLDSSSMVALCRQCAPSARMEAVTVVHDQADINELEYAQEVAKAADCTLHAVRGGEVDLSRDLPGILACQDEPCLSTTLVNHWRLMKEIKSHGVKVALSGQGVDETAYGYVPLLMGYLFGDMLREGAWGRLARAVASHRRALREDRAMTLRDFLAWAGKGLVGRGLARRVKARMLSGTSAIVRRQYRESGAIDRLMDGEGEGIESGLKRAMYFMVMHESLPYILRYEDRNSMSFGIEQRVPFLDRELVVFLMRLPAGMLVKDGVSKWIIREAMRGMLPERVRLRRRKIGFSTPEGAWVRSQAMAGLVRECGLERALRDSPVDVPAAMAMERRVLADGSRDPSPLWRLYSYALWRANRRTA